MSGGNGRLVAVEALARWQHPVRGSVPPSVFVPEFGRAGLGMELLAGVTRLVATQLRRNDSPAVPISINVDDEVTTVRWWHSAFLELLAAERIPTAAIWLELTERVDPADRPDRWHTAFEELSAAGVRLALDDVGHGVDRLELLYRLPIEVVKLDRSLVEGAAIAGCGSGPAATRARRFLTGLADWCRSQQLLTVAEGIATAGQQRAVTDGGWVAGQGYRLGRPNGLLRQISQFLQQPQLPAPPPDNAAPHNTAPAGRSPVNTAPHDDAAPDTTAPDNSAPAASTARPAPPSVGVPAGPAAAAQ